ncbi:MAG TPA: flagellar FlbD family protein [Polyangia bacterium]
MILVTRLDGSELVINVDLIMTIERTPDTVLTLTTGDRFMVKESLDEIVSRAVAYRYRISQGPGIRDGLDAIAEAMREPGRDSGRESKPGSGGKE